MPAALKRSWLWKNKINGRVQNEHALVIAFPFGEGGTPIGVTDEAIETSPDLALLGHPPQRGGLISYSIACN